MMLNKELQRAPVTSFVFVRLVFVLRVLSYQETEHGDDFIC